MAYKYEIDQKANTVKVRVLIAVYVMFVVSAVLIGVAVRLQQLQSIRPSSPRADTAGNPAAAAVSQASDPTYEVRQLGALAYCDVVDAGGNETGTKLPLAARFTFKQIRRDVGQYGTELGTVCSSATGGVCNWKTINNPAARCRDGQTLAQCNPADFYACDDGAVPGAHFYYAVTKDSTVTNYMVTWPGTESLGNLIYDNNEVDVFLNQNMGDLAGPTITRNGVVYTIDKSSLSTLDTASIFPIYNWRCNNDVCSSGTCTNGSLSYHDTLCSFNSVSRVFTCPTNKYVRYPVLLDHKSFYYNLSNKAGQVATDPSWVKMGYAYESLADNTYGNAMPGANDNAMTFKGNIAKFRYTCRTDTVTTPPVTSTVISARKTGPICVERMAPNNSATFTITVSNNSASTATINNVEDALPQGFTYKANTTVINGNVTSDSYVTVVNSGNSQKVTFAPPAGQPAWTLTQGQTLTIVFTTLASTTAVTGINTNRVVVTPEGTEAIDNITYQFEVAQTCSIIPDTGLFDEPTLVFILSGCVIILGLYLLYAPGGDKFLGKLGGLGAGIEEKILATGKRLEAEADKKKQFEKKVLQRKNGK